MILIGSTAIKHWFPDFPREPKDTDYIGTGKAVPGIEYLPNPILDNYQSDIITANDLLTLKMSHLFWDINWDKHMFDVQFLLKKGCVFNPLLFDKLYAYWNTVHVPNKRSDLQMSATEFFDNALKEYDHDFLHTLLKPVPTYTKVLIGEVEVSEVKFNTLTEEEKEDLVREEVMIMAFERYQHLGYQRAYGRMLKKFIMNHAPMWEAIWIIKNFIKLHKTNFNFINHLKNELHKTKQVFS